MPYDRTEPARWWHGAEAAPPVPDGPGPWELGPTPYGWAWRRPEPEPGALDADALRAFLAPAKPGTYRLVKTPDGWQYRRVGEGGGSGLITGEPFAVSPMPDAPSVAAPPVPLPEVRVGDLLHHGASILPHRVSAVLGADAAVDCGEYQSWVALADIGPEGSGRPWTLLPRDPAPDALTDAERAEWIAAALSGMAFGHRDAPWNKAERDGTPRVADLRTCQALVSDPASVAPDVDLVGIVREGMRALDRIEAASGGGGGGGAYVGVDTGSASDKTVIRSVAIGAGGPGGYSGPPVDTLVRIYTPDGTLVGVAAPGTTFLVDLPDPRREAERRVVQAARALLTRADALTSADAAEGHLSVVAEWDPLRDALDALAALDGEDGA